MTNFEPKPQPAIVGVALAPIRFGELGVGSKFVYGGCWLVKTGDYAAESDRRRGKTSYLFFKKDVVKGIKTFSEDSPLLHENGATSPTNFIEPRTKIVSKDDLFTATSDFVEKPKPQCEIVISPGENDHRVEVRGDNGYRWERTFKGDISRSWSVPLLLKNNEITLMYDNEELELYFEGMMIWSKKFHGWAGVHTCTICIKDFRLEPDDT